MSGTIVQELPLSYTSKDKEINNGLDRVAFAGQTTDLAYKVLYPQYLEKRAELDIKLANSDWRVLCSSGDVGASQYSYKAVAFINAKSKEMHIASAGTKADVNDLLDDARLLIDVLPSKLKPAQDFLSKVVDLVGGDAAAKEYKFSTSGHSLGAIVSDLTGAEILSRGFCFESSTTFENPGSANVIKEGIKAGLFTGKDPWQVSTLSERCTVYNAAPNFINSCKYSFADNINLVLHPQAVSEKSADTTQSWGAYLYDVVGNTAETCLGFLGIKKAVNTVSEHKLGNFLNLEQALVVPLDRDSWSSKDCKQLVLKLKVEHPLLQTLAQKGSTGSDVVILNKMGDSEEGYSFMEVSMGEYSFEDLRRAGFALKSMYTAQQQCDPTFVPLDLELLNDVLEEDLNFDEGYSSDNEVNSENIVHAVVSFDNKLHEQRLPIYNCTNFAGSDNHYASLITAY